MKKKLIIIGLILCIIIFLINKFYIKNYSCKSENGSYEVYAAWGSSTPINITGRINDCDCECIDEFLIVEKKPIQFSDEQLSEIKKQLPNWAIKNCKNFSINDKKKLENEYKKISNEDFFKLFKYKYTFFLFVGNVPVYTINIKNSLAYCPNYSYVYDLYDGKYAPKSDGREPFGKKLNYPIIESELWIKTKFGKKGI